MILIKKPEIILMENTSRLSCDILVDDQIRNVWFEVEKEYEQYLCTERSDAFLIGVLSWAMRLNHDITCEVPVTDELLYNLNTYLIHSVVKNSKTLHLIKINAEMAPALENAGAVGTGCSCGVDSFHSILSNYNSVYPNARLTHLVLNNVGSFGKSDNNGIDKDLIETRRTVTRKIANELNLKVVITNSNFADAFIQNHYLTNTYSSMFAVFALQKLWKTYFYASCEEISNFNLKHNDLYDTSLYDLLTLNCLSNHNMRIYSEGITKSRLDKIRFIADNKLVQDNLHVCLYKSKNCSLCSKCRRTMNELYAIGKLDKFSNVFDIKKYYNKKNSYFRELYFLHLQKDSIIIPEYEILKHEINLTVKVSVIFKIFKQYIVNIFHKKSQQDNVNSLFK